jgi:hypothetical protein
VGRELLEVITKGSVGQAGWWAGWQALAPRGYDGLAEGTYLGSSLLVLGSH